MDWLLICFRSLAVGVGVFLRRENPEFAILAAILENTRPGGAGRAIVVFGLARSSPGPRVLKTQDGARSANGPGFPR